MLLIVVLSSPFDTPAVASSGQGSTARVQTCVRPALFRTQYKQQHPREPLQPYPVPTLPWHLVSQDLFEPNGTAYVVTVDHFSDSYEIDRLRSIQSLAVVQTIKQHFGRHGIPHTLLTDNGSQCTSDLLEEFAKTYKHTSTSHQLLTDHYPMDELKQP